MKYRATALAATGLLLLAGCTGNDTDGDAAGDGTTTVVGSNGGESEVCTYLPDPDDPDSLVTWESAPGTPCNPGSLLHEFCDAASPDDIPPDRLAAFEAYFPAENEHASLCAELAEAREADSE